MRKQPVSVLVSFWLARQGTRPFPTTKVSLLVWTWTSSEGKEKHSDDKESRPRHLSGYVTGCKDGLQNLPSVSANQDKYLLIPATLQSKLTQADKARLYS